MAEDEKGVQTQIQRKGQKDQRRERERAFPS